MKENPLFAEEIAERRERLRSLARQSDDIQRQMLGVEGEIRAYTDAAAKAAKSNATVRRVRETITAEPPSEEISSRAVKRMTPPWRAIFLELGKRNPNTVSNDEMREIAKKSGHILAGPKLRQMVFIYSDRGWMKRVRPGVYRITDTGLQIVQMLKGDLFSKAS